MTAKDAYNLETLKMQEQIAKIGEQILRFSETEALLARRCKEIANPQNSIRQIKENWFLGQDKPIADGKLVESVRKEIAKTIASTKTAEKTFVEYSYRPLLTTYAFVAEPVLHILSKTGGKGTRYRPEILSAFRSRKTIGIAVTPARSEGCRCGVASFCFFLLEHSRQRFV